ALLGLHEVAPDEFHKRLIAVLGDLPAWPDKKKLHDLLPAYYGCIAEVAKLTDDVKVWTAVGKYLGSASPEVKIEWVHELTFWPAPEDKCYRGVLQSVAALLNDDSVRVRKDGDKISIFSVRNDAAEELGRMLH